MIMRNCSRKWRQMSVIGSWCQYVYNSSTLKREIRRVKRGHDIALANKVKENPKRFYRYINTKVKNRDP